MDKSIIENIRQSIINGNKYDNIHTVVTRDPLTPAQIEQIKKDPLLNSVVILSGQEGLNFLNQYNRYAAKRSRQ